MPTAAMVETGLNPRRVVCGEGTSTRVTSMHPPEVCSAAKLETGLNPRRVVCGEGTSTGVTLIFLKREEIQME